MKKLHVVEYKGFRVVSSVDVAASLERKHDLFVQRIDRLIQELNLHATTAPDAGRVSYFLRSDGPNAAESSLHIYWITFEGCELIATHLANAKKAPKFRDCFHAAFAAYEAAGSSGAHSRPARGAGPAFSLSDIEPVATKTFVQTEYWMNEQGTSLPKIREALYIRNGEEVHVYVLQDGRHIAYAMDGILLDRYQMLAAAVRKDKEVARELLDFAQMLYYQKNDRDFDTLFDYVKEHVLQ